MIHAELYGMIIEAGGYDELQEFAKNYQGEDDFLMIWEYYETHGDFSDTNTGWQHQIMAKNYVQYIADGLKELHGDLSSQALKDLYEDGMTFHDATFSWDKLFKYLAWEGLHKTDNFQIEIVEKGLEDDYNHYRDVLRLESQTNKCK